MDQTKTARSSFASALHKLDKRVQSLDSFGESFRMKLDRDQHVVQSLIGSCFTFILFIGVVFYFYLKLDVFINKKDVDIMTSFKEGALDTDFVMTYEAGLNFAAAFTAFDSVREPILDRSIGELVFKAWEWGENEDG